MFLSTTPARMRWPAGLCVMHAGLLNSGDCLCPASIHDMRSAEHELVDMGEVALALAAKQPLRGGKRWATKKGKCAYEKCAVSKPVRPQHRCGSCNGGRGAFYHPRCFFAVHRCLYKA